MTVRWTETTVDNAQKVIETNMKVFDDLIYEGNKTTYQFLAGNFKFFGGKIKLLRCLLFYCFLIKSFKVFGGDFMCCHGDIRVILISIYRTY